MPLNPPICLEAFYSNLQQGESANEYTVTLTTPGQGYNGGNNFYYFTDVVTGMWTANNSYGYAFRIKTISNLTELTCDVVLEDVDGFNALIDPGGTGGGPANDTMGYIFELNANGFPVFTEVDDPPNVVWIDSLVARFSFQNPRVGPTSIFLTTAETQILSDTPEPYLSSTVDTTFSCKCMVSGIFTFQNLVDNTVGNFARCQIYVNDVAVGISMAICPINIAYLGQYSQLRVEYIGPLTNISPSTNTIALYIYSDTGIGLETINGTLTILSGLP